MGSKCNFMHVQDNKGKQRAEDAQPNEGVQLWKSKGKDIIPPVIATPTKRPVETKSATSPQFYSWRDREI